MEKSLLEDKKEMVKELIKNAKDAGMKDPYSDMIGKCCSVGSSGENIIYPSMSVDEMQVPDLEGYSAGDECLLFVKGTIESKNERYDSKKEKRNCDYYIKVKKISIL